jgi:ribonuclease P/MRP protein subunit RPP40
LANQWVASFLAGRRQAVLDADSLSYWSDVQSGVPQGSVIGPLLFVILINTLPDSTSPETFVRMFADDMRAARAIRALADACLLQEDLFQMYDWNLTAHLFENNDKFETLQYGGNMELKKQYNYMTLDCDSNIIKKHTVKDLGVYISDDCEFSVQISSVKAKVKKTFGWAKRSFVSREANFLRFLCKTYCLPLIDYASQLWMPLGTPMIKKRGASPSVSN